MAVDMEEGRWYLTTVRNAAAEQDFYTIELDGKRSDLAEKALGGIEAKVSPAFARIDEGMWPPDLDVRTGLVNFLALQMVRGGDWREQIRSAEEEAIIKKLAPVASDPRALRDAVESVTSQRLGKSQIRALQSSLADGVVPVDFPTGFLVNKMFERGARLVDLLARMTMQLVEAESGFFWTSDTPVYFDGEYDFDHASRQVKVKRFEVTMPLDPTHSIVLLTPSARGEVKRRVGEATVREWNRRLAGITERRLYARPDTVELDRRGGSLRDLQTSEVAER